MTKKYIGKRITRNEDPRLLTGQALFVDDVDIPGMLHAAFVRSDYAHARIRSIDVSAARQRPGVVAIYTAEDMGAKSVTSEDFIVSINQDSNRDQYKTTKEKYQPENVDVNYWLNKFNQSGENSQ